MRQTESANRGKKGFLCDLRAVSAISAVKSSLHGVCGIWPTEKRPSAEANGLSYELCSVAGAAGFALLIVELVANAIAEFLHFVGKGVTGLFAAGWSQ